MDRVSPDSPMLPDQNTESTEKEKREQALDRVTKLALETVDELSHKPKQD
ncbi:hypothetical protein [Vibrio sp. HN007]